jgi:hypothetical protein
MIIRIIYYQLISLSDIEMKNRKKIWIKDTRNCKSRLHLRET